MLEVPRLPVLEVPRIPTFDLEAAAAILQEAAEKTSVAPTTKPTTIRVPSGELAFGDSLVPQEVVIVKRDTRVPTTEPPLGEDNLSLLLSAVLGDYGPRTIVPTSAPTRAPTSEPTQPVSKVVEEVAEIFTIEIQTEINM